MPDGMPNGKQHLYRRSIPLVRPAIRYLNIQNIGTATVLMQHDCIRTVRRGSGGIMPLYMIRTRFQWIGRRMTLRPSRDARPFNDRVVHYTWADRPDVAFIPARLCRVEVFCEAYYNKKIFVNIYLEESEKSGSSFLG